MTLAELGWCDLFAGHFQALSGDHLVPGRGVREDRGQYLVSAAAGEVTARVTGKLRHDAESRASLPAVGDWVALDLCAMAGPSTIQEVLPRKSKFSRTAAGGGGRAATEQVVAANVDVVFLVSGLDGGRNFNPRRIERYTTLAWESGATPIVVLNKCDVCPDVAACRREVERVAPGVDIYPVSALNGDGVGELAACLPTGRTGVFMGSSGVGKSSLINALLGEQRLVTAAVRGDDREGRHTTTWRELIRLPAAGLIIDTPGMRELRLWGGDEDGLSSTFEDIEGLAADCRFRDCSHRAEPGCAVQQALADGNLEPSRLASYRKLQRERAHAAARRDASERLVEKRRWKKIAKWSRQMKKEREKF
jgi:ribosome biogenesis GTPase